MSEKKDVFEIIKGDDGTSIIDVFVNRKDIKKYIPEVKEGHLIIETDDEELIDAGNVVGKDGEDGKDGKDGKDYILTSKDKEDIAGEITVPIVEKVIEKTEIIKEVPIITNEIKEVAKYETPKEIVNKIESLEGKERLSAKAIKDLDLFVKNTKVGATRLESLNDINITNPTTGQILVYDQLRSQRENKNNSSSLPNPTTGEGSSSTNPTYAVQDGTILYHLQRWFVPTNVISTVGTTVTTVSGQFSSAMVGAKLTINGESRIITAFVSATQVTVGVAYNTNYTNVVSTAWGVYSILMQTVSGSTNFYTTTGSSWINQIGGGVSSPFFNATGGNFLLSGTGLDLANQTQLKFSSTTSSSGTKDLGIRRNAAGILEIYDGITATGLDANRRDLLVRNITATTLGTIGNAAAATSVLNILGGAGGNAMVRLVRTSGVTAAFQWALSTGGMTFADETNGGTPLALYGGTTLSAHIGLRGTGTAYTTPSLLGATTFSTAAGTDVNAVNFTIQGGLGTGTGTLGDINFNTGNTAASGSVHTSTSKMTIKGNGNVGIGGNAPSTKLDVVVTSSDGASSLHGIRINSGFPTNPQAIQLGTNDTGQYSWIQSRQQGINNTTLALNPIGGTVVVGGNTANNNAILDVQSTTRAFMPPRMTTAQKNAIASPTAGMMVYDTTLNAFSGYTTTWITL